MRAPLFSLAQADGDARPMRPETATEHVRNALQIMQAWHSDDYPDSVRVRAEDFAAVYARLGKALAAMREGHV